LSFIPKNLFEQFRRVANFFFLLLVILQSFPLFKTVHPIIAALPIIFIVAVTAVKDGVEDYRRWMSDKQVNNRQAFTLGQDHWRNYNYPDIINIRLAKKIRRKIRYYIDLLITQIGLFKDRLEQRTRQYSERPIAIDVGGYRWVQTSWKDIRVGDIIYVQNNDALPADIIVLSTSETDNLCYVETKNLDGETNLKLKQGPTELMWVKQPDDCAVKLKLVIDSEPPTTNMLRYQATILYMPPHDLHTELSLTRNSLDSSAGEQSRTTLDGGKSMEMINKGKKSADIQKRIPVDINGILLRGCVLRNTKWVIGVVVFTGDDTKQILNSGKTPSKQSEVEKRMNPHVMISLMLLVVMCAIVSIGYSVQSRAQNANDTTFGEAAFAPDLEAFVNFFNALILFQNIVPISLYISIEIVKTVQAYFIYSDLELYYEENDTPCVPKSWNLSDNLGQIEYIFSDKTGTLTRNIMEFKKCSIAGVVYDGTGKKSGSDDGLNMQPSRMAQSSRASTYSIKADWVETGKGHNRVSSLIKDDDLLHTPGSTNANKSTKHLKHSSIDAPTIASVMEEEGPILEVDDNVETFFDDALFEYLDDRIKMTTPHGVAIKDFFTLLAVCHTVLLEEKSDRESRNTQNSITQALANNTAKMPVLKYKAQSPDEACLVTFAAECGFVFKGREHNAETEQNEIVIDALGEEARYGLLNVLEFDSDRKRMSVIVRTAGTNGKKGDVILFCKGADSVIFERLLHGQNEAKEKANANLDHFAKDGLRTLCLAYRKVPNEQYESWSKRYFEAVTQIYPDSTARSRALDTLNNEIESKLILLGITAIEDKLQEGVPECITTLADAGIKIWVLTGDKMETAINVGFLCGLLKTTEVFDEDAEVSESEMILIQIKNANNENEVKRQFNAAAERFFASNLLSEPLERSNTGALMNKEFALIIDGQSLKYALESEETKTLMLNIALKCKAVVCCRVSPLQKAKVVEMVKSGRNVITLAIGDGANGKFLLQMLLNL
jgi:phospholipid-translocating ATPase